MKKNLIPFVGFVLTIALVSTSYGIVIGDFEGESLDGWGPAWGDAEVTINFSDIGVTSGSSSIAVTAPCGGYWRLQWVGALDMTGMTQMSADLTFVPGEWTPVEDGGPWAQLDAIAIQPGWYQVSPSAIIDRITGEPVGKAWPGTDKPLEEETHRTYIWDISGWSGVPAEEIFLAVQCGDFSQAGTYYIDNIQVIPEPATIALLGLGGLALIRRKW